MPYPGAINPSLTFLDAIPLEKKLEKPLLPSSVLSGILEVIVIFNLLFAN